MMTASTPGGVTRDEIAAVIHRAQCGCTIGLNSARNHFLTPIHYPDYMEAADAVVALLRGEKSKADDAAVLDEFARDILGRCRIAIRDYGGRVNPAWSTGEKLAVALVLRDKATVDEMGYSVREAAERVAGGMWSPPRDMKAWLDTIRVRLGRATVDREA
nr:hypothetical protein [Kibdelosporangium sp. MJ126-NF4]CTQ96916.1 hypothetical protein [Kibdelosporangium sp. MJ126-NF4]